MKSDSRPRLTTTLSGIPQPSLSRLLNTMSEPRPSTLARLAQAMGLTVADLDPRPARPEQSLQARAEERRVRIRALAFEETRQQLDFREAA